MGWNEWPLILFTVIAQSAVGGFWWCCWALQGRQLPAESRTRLQRHMLLLWILMGLAFVFSSAHLGSPMRAVNSLLRVGQTPLSNEIFFGAGFVALGVAYWFMTWRQWGSAVWRRLILGVGLVFSVAFLWNMTAFYMMPTVPTWNTALTPMAFVLTAVLGGGAVALVLFASAMPHAPEGWVHKWPVRCAGLALMLAVAVALMQASSLPHIVSSIQRASDLSPHYGGLMAARFVLLFLVIAAWARMVQQGRVSTSKAVLCLGGVLLAEMIGRGVFYALHMTVGLV